MTKGKIEDVLESTQSGFACSKSFETTVDKGALHLRPNNIGYWGTLNLSKKTYIQKKKVDAAKHGIKKDELLFNNTNSKELVGRTTFVRENLDAAFSNHITRIRVDEEKIDARWLHYYLNKLWSEGYFLHLSKKWIGQAGVDTTMLKNTPIEYPELSEQKKAADRLDEVFSDVENGLDKIASQRIQVNELKQAILGSVFSNLEWQTHKLSDVADINPRKNVGELATTDGVSFVPMESVDDITGQIVSKQTRDLGTVARGYTAFQNGDVIFAKITPCMENGKCAVADGLENGIGFGSTEFYVVRPKENISAAYLWHFLRQESVRAEAKKHFTGAAGHKRVPKTFVENLELPVPLKNGKPDLVQQQKAVAELAKKFKTIDELLGLLAKQEQALNSLRLSLLDTMLKPKTTDEPIASPLRFSISPRMFDIQQAVAQIIKRFQRGEMVVAKILYIGQAIYDVPTNIQFTPQHFGPYDSIVKKAVMSGLSPSNRFFARRGTGHTQVLTLGENGKAILRYSTSELARRVNLYLDEMMPYFYQCDSAAIERLATVCKIIEDEQTADDATVKAKLQQWKPNKFTDQEVSRTLAFIKKREWDKRLIKK